MNKSPKPDFNLEDLAKVILGGGPAAPIIDPDLRYEGRQITLPSDPRPMPIRDAIEALERKAADAERVFLVHEDVEGFQPDVMVAFTRAMKQTFGWTEHVNSIGHGFFGKFTTPPATLAVRTGPGEDDIEYVPHGVFRIPGVDHDVEVSFNYTGGYVESETNKAGEHIIKELAKLTRQLLRKSSIYKGKAIQIGAYFDAGEREYKLNTNEILFFDPAPLHTMRSELVLNAPEYAQIDTALWAPIRHTKAARKHGIPLKRGILLEGTYGIGKSMTAGVTAGICVEHGWTYVLLNDVEALAEAVEFAQRYAPAVLFAEDVDRIISDRGEKGANDLLNIVDGILAKSSEVIVVLTTNHIERIERAMLRPGRLDAVISLQAPNAESVERLIRLYGRGLLADEEPLARIGRSLAGHIPAIIREVVERSKLSMINRDATAINEDDLLIAAQGMKRHLELLNPPVAERSPAETLADSLHEIVHTPRKPRANGAAARVG